MHVKFAIIGGGLTATAMLSQWVSRLQETIRAHQLNPAGIHIHIFEKQNQFGPGFPHSNRITLPFHITNMCASDMGVFLDRPDDFQNWVTANDSQLIHRFSWFRDMASEIAGPGEACHHYPRAIMGEYLKARFQEAVDESREIGMQVHLHPRCEVVALREDDDGIRLRIKNLASKRVTAQGADRVLLATGHWSENNDQKGYSASPWPAERLRRRIPQGEKIAVIGTSLSAIETLLTLTSEGNFIRTNNGELIYQRPLHSRIFTLYSRNGLLPKVRGKLGDYKNRFFNSEGIDRLLSQRRGTLTLKEVFSLLNTELEHAYGKRIDWNAVVSPTAQPMDLLQRDLENALHGDGPQGEIVWQTVLYQSLDRARDLYLNLTLEERKRFDRKFTSLFFTHAASQPSINAEKVLALMQAGVVSVVKLGPNYRLNRIEHEGGYELIYQDALGNEQKDVFRYVINARGQQRSYTTNPDPLAHHLIESGIVQIEEFRPIEPTAGSHRSRLSKATPGHDSYRTGSIWIDPDTHRVMQVDSDGRIKKSNALYAVGAMTRGQIIDASMARGIVRATTQIADEWIAYLIRLERG